MGLVASLPSRGAGGLTPPFALDPYFVGWVGQAGIVLCWTEYVIGW